MSKKVAVIGGGLCGLTTAIRLGEMGVHVTLFEAASDLGGRTRSFVDKTTGELCDNGPHLLIGAYRATQKLLHDCQASTHVTWQDSLRLPLWDRQRQHFQLAPAAWAPLSLALPLAIKGLPGHQWRSASSMLRLAQAVRKEEQAVRSVSDLIRQCNAPDALVRDLLEPLCLGVMNEGIESANASTFKRVLRESFRSKDTARLGWFNAPLQQALIEPLAKRCEQLGVTIQTKCRIHAIREQDSDVMVNDIRFDAAVISLPTYASAALLNRENSCNTNCITNIHLWYESHPGLPAPLVGGIGTTGQWFFDVSMQMQQQSPLRHICAVISADNGEIEGEKLTALIQREVSAISRCEHKPTHCQTIREKRATVLVSKQSKKYKSMRIFDATEAPAAGDLPATVELAVQRGEKAAHQVANSLL